MQNVLEAIRDLVTLDLSRSDPYANGLYVYRPVVNAEEWKAWMAKHAFPGQVSDLHVTVVYSKVDVKIPLASDYPVVWAGDAALMKFGPDEDTLVLAFDGYQIADRNWAYQRAGAEHGYPTYRPHMSLAKPPADWEFPDAALMDMPKYVVLGPEVREPLKDKSVPADDADPEGEGEDTTLVIIVEIAASAAATVLESQTVVSPVDRVALADIAASRPVTKGVAKRLAAVEGMPAEIVALAGVPQPSTAAESEKQLAVKDVERTGAEITKALGDKAMEVVKANDDRQWVYHIGNVSTIGGELYVDAHGDSFTTEALEEFCVDLIRGQRLGKVDHGHGPANEIVQGLVLSNEVQKALGIDLGFEALILCTHVPDAALWTDVKTGKWETSIAGRFIYDPD